MHLMKVCMQQKVMLLYGRGWYEQKRSTKLCTNNYKCDTLYNKDALNCEPNKMHDVMTRIE